MWVLMQQVKYLTYILHPSNTWGKNGNTTKKAYDSVRREVLYNILRVWYTGKANKDVSE